MMRLRFLGFALALLALPATAQVTLSSAPSPLPAGTVGVAYPAASITAAGGTAPYSYLVTSTTPNILPPGLSLATSGALSGTPSSAGTFTFTVTATDSTAGTALTAAQSFSITINPAPSITTSTLPAWSAGATTPYSQTLAATGGTGALTYSLTGGALPTGLSLSSGGTITGTPSAAGTANFTVTVTDSLGASGPKALSITINAAPTISTASPLPSGAQTIAYSTSLAATGGTGALTFAASTPVPAGLTISSAGVLSGTPTVSGDFNITFRVTDSLGAFSEKLLALSLVPQPVIGGLSPSSAPAGVADVALTITGTGFSPNVTVNFGATAIAVASASATQINVTIPVAAITTPGSINVTVNNLSLITSAPSAFTVNGPSITSLAPTSAFAGGPAFTLTVNGANFVNGSTYKSEIRWNGNALTTTFVNTGQLTAQAPANLIAAAGTAAVTVASTPNAISMPANFTISPPPAISSLAPSSISAGAPGFNLTVSGTGFVAASVVHWAGTALTTAYVSATQLTAAVPAGLLLNPGAVNVTVVNPGPVTSAPATFTVGAAPTITTIAPVAVTAGAPTFNLVVNGAGFNATSVIRISGQALVTTFLSATQLSALVTPALIPSAGSAAITVVNSGPVSSNSVTLLINPPAQFVTSTLTTGLIGVPYTQAINITGGTPPFLFAFANGVFPPGLSLNGTTGAITGVPTTSGLYDFTLQVTDASGFVVTRLYTLVVAPPLSITTAEALPTAAAGLAYSTQLVAAGGAPPYVNWVVTTGSLPPGIALNAATGLLSGTPTTTGSFAFLVQVRDSANQTASKGFTLVVNAGLSITTTAQPPTGTLGTAYTFALAAAGGTQPYTWSVATGSLPAGLSLNTTTGAITGTPTAAGSTTFTMEVKDAAGQTARAPYTIEVLSGLSITNPTALPTATARAPYTVTFLASGGTTPYASWRIISGSVPAALVLNAATGELAGTPAAAGDFTFTIAVNDATARTVSKAFTLTVLPPGLSITTPAALPAATFGSAYGVNLQADGGTPPYRWLLTTGTLPAGLTLASGGALSGTPTLLGSTTFGLTVIDSNTRSVTRDFTLAVTSPALPSFTLAGPAGTVEPGTQPRLSLELAAPYPSALSGAIAITFLPDTVNTPASPADDPALQFANGSRTLRFSIPAGATAAEFEGTPAFQTGTVAGTITLTPLFTSGGTALSGASPRLIRILRSAPALRAATVTRTASGFDVAITGFATPREVTQAVFRFTPASGANLQTTELTIPLTAPSATWFSSDGARAFGSQFTYRQPFTLSGDTAAVSSLSVTLSNSVGASQPVTANVP